MSATNRTTGMDSAIPAKNNLMKSFFVMGEILTGKCRER